jgi:hypothetical protein
MAVTTFSVDKMLDCKCRKLTRHTYVLYIYKLTQNMRWPSVEKQISLLVDVSFMKSCSIVMQT